LPMGITGTLLIALSFGYVARKRLGAPMRWGSHQRWLRVHIAAGLLGPAFIIVHSGLAPYSALGWLAFLSTGVIVASGFVGRYLLAYVPRGTNGEEPGIDGVRRRLVAYARELLALGFDPSQLGDVTAVDEARRRPSLLYSVVQGVTGDRESRREHQRLQGAIGAGDFATIDADRMRILVRRITRERLWLAHYDEFNRIVGTWRFLHLWFAVILVFGAGLHIMVALRFGDLWIFRGGH